MLYTSDYDFDSDSFASEKQHYDQIHYFRINLISPLLVP